MRSSKKVTRSRPTSAIILSAGSNDYEQLCRAGENIIPSPIDLIGSNISSVSLGSFHCAAVYNNGTVYGWGLNSGGKIGLPFNKNKYENNKIHTPTLINDLPPIVKVKCGRDFTLFLSENKCAFIASLKKDRKELVQRIFIKKNIISIFGSAYPWIVTDDNSLYKITNYNEEGAIKLQKYKLPIKARIKTIISLLSVSTDICLSESGETFGIGSAAYSSTVFVEIESLKKIKIRKVSGIINHIVALSEEGLVYVWGNNFHGELGLGNKDEFLNDFIQIPKFKIPKIVDVSAGSGFTMFVDAEGKVWATGNGDSGRTFFLEETNQISPKRVSSIERAVAVSCGNDFTYVQIDGSPIFEDFQKPAQNSGLDLKPISQNWDKEKPCEKEEFGYKKEYFNEISSEKIQQLENELNISKEKAKLVSEYLEKEKREGNKINEELRQQFEKEKNTSNKLRLKNQQLEDDLKKSNEEIKHMSEFMAIQKREANNISEELRIKNRKLEDDLKKRNEEIKLISESLEKEKRERNKINEELRQQFEKEKNASNKLRLKNRQLEDDLKKSNEEIKHKNEFIAKQKREINNIPEDLRLKNRQLEDDLKKSNEEIKHKNESMAIQAQEADKANNKLRIIIQQLEKEIKKINDGVKYKDNLKTREIEILDEDTLRSLKEVKTIGRGATSDVIEVVREEKYALKIITLNDIDENQTKHFLREYEILNFLNHRNIIKTFGINFNGGKEFNQKSKMKSDSERKDFIQPIMLLEYCPRNLTKEEVEKMGKLDKIKVIYEIVEGMICVHSKGIIHRDIKPENILIDSKGRTKISDFGISTIASIETLTKGVGTTKFMAPELLNGAEHYSEKVDNYAFGVLLYFILTNGEYPKISLSQVGMGKKAPIPNSINSISKNIINKCWSLSAEERPSFIEIKEEMKRQEYEIISLSMEEKKDIKKKIDNL